MKESDFVQDKTERWFHLCQQAAVEQDPDKLLALIQEINDILEDQERRLLREREEQRREELGRDKPHPEG